MFAQRSRALIRPLLAAVSFVVLLGGRADAAKSAVPPDVKFDGGAVVISNLTPAGRVVLITIGLGSKRGIFHEIAGEIVLNDDDGDGVVRFVPRNGVPLRSIWVAVDFASGEYTIAGAPGYSVDVRDFPNEKLKRNGQGEIDVLEEDRHELRLTVVRPDAGAWHIDAVEGSALDGDRRHDGTLRIALESADPLIGTDRLKHIRNGDTVIGIDPRELQVYATRSK